MTSMSCTERTYRTSMMKLEQFLNLNYKKKVNVGEEEENKTDKDNEIAKGKVMFFSWDG